MRLPRWLACCAAPPAVKGEDDDDAQAAAAAQDEAADEPAITPHPSAPLIDPMLDKPLATDVLEKYEIGKVLGRGAFGTTRLCWTKGNESKKFAVKSILKRRVVDGEGVRRELDIMLHLSGHPGVVHLVDYFEDDIYIHLVMELCAGGDLVQIITQKGSYTERDAAAVMRTVLEVLAYAHDMGCMHRDIKPDNCLVTGEGPATNGGGGGGGGEPTPSGASGSGPAPSAEASRHSSKGLPAPAVAAVSGASAAAGAAGKKAAAAMKVPAPAGPASGAATGAAAGAAGAAEAATPAAQSAAAAPADGSPAGPAADPTEEPEAAAGAAGAEVAAAAVGAAAPGAKPALKLADWGYATFIKPGQVLEDKVGTCFYMAPEVLMGSYNEKADVWSCGVMLYILLAGRPPFYAIRDEDVFRKIMDDGVPPMTGHPWDTISEPAKDAVRRMMTWEPAARPGAREMLEDAWIRADGAAGDNVIQPEVLHRLRSFAAMNEFKKHAALLIAGHLPHDQVRGLKELFDAMDADGSGAITLDELRQALEARGSSLPEAELRELFEMADENGDGELDYAEFIATTLHQCRLAEHDNLVWAFKQFDKDGDGFITADELREALAASGHGRVNVDQIIASADTRPGPGGGDGKIDYVEFVIMMTGASYDDAMADDVMRAHGAAELAEVWAENGAGGSEAAAAAAGPGGADGDGQGGAADRDGPAAAAAAKKA